mmetsp:Transcript_2155/g.9802  ORF Transcript_2155/g.9802 Transcript_2155/m.9802 type:complete len:202 (+) Transcript_2155:1657-2262(+)
MIASWKLGSNGAPTPSTVDSPWLVRMVISPSTRPWYCDTTFCASSSSGLRLACARSKLSSAGSSASKNLLFAVCESCSFSLSVRFLKLSKSALSRRYWSLRVSAWSLRPTFAAWMSPKADSMPETSEVSSGRTSAKTSAAFPASTASWSLLSSSLHLLASTAAGSSTSSSSSSSSTTSTSGSAARLAFSSSSSSSPSPPAA